jgi:hypothetical protein
MIPLGDADVIVDVVVWSFGIMLVDEEAPSDCILVESKVVSNCPRSTPSAVKRSVVRAV